MVKSGRSGWYYRVLEAGAVAAGANLALIDRRHPEWNVERVTGIVIAGRERNLPTLRALINLPVLADGWRDRLVALIA
jgi:MOSC domain-containing protein YiiM